MVSAASTALVSISVVSALSTCVNVPLRVTVLLPPPTTVAPNAVPIDSSPLVSASVTVSPSVPIALGSLTEMPLTACAVPTPTITDAGALTTGSPVTVTPIVCVPAVKPNWSVALTVIGSDPVTPPVSLRLAKVAFTSASVPLTFSALVPEPVRVAAPLMVAASRPLPSASVTLNGSVEAAPLSTTLTPPIAAALPVPTSAALGTVSTGPFTTVTAIVFGVAVLPRESRVVMTIESAPSVGSFTLRLATAWLTWASEPLMVKVLLPCPPMPAKPGLLVTDSAPLLSVRVIVKDSPLVLPVSLSVTPAIASGLLMPAVTLAGAATTGAPFTDRPTVLMPATLPN